MQQGVGCISSILCPSQLSLLLLWDSKMSAGFQAE